MGSATIVVVGSMLYGAVLLMGLLHLPSHHQPLGDPWFAAMEWLIVLIAPAMVGLVAGLRAWAAPERLAFGRAALAVMALAAALTVGVHLTLLVGASRAEATAAFRWPSIPYSLDILAWDLLFAIAVLLGAPLVQGGRLAGWTRRLLVGAGLLSLAGLAGVPLGDMRVRDIGIVGYGVVFPIAALLMLVLFLRTPIGEPSEATRV